MKIVLQKNMTKKIIGVKGQNEQTRFFTLEFPFDANLGELYDVVAEFKNEFFKNMEEQKAREEAMTQSEEENQVKEEVVEEKNENNVEE